MLCQEIHCLALLADDNDGTVMVQMLDEKQCGSSQQHCQAVACCLSPLMVSLRSMSLFWGCPESSTMQRILGLSNVNLQTAEHICHG